MKYFAIKTDGLIKKEIYVFEVSKEFYDIISKKKKTPYPCMSNEKVIWSSAEHFGDNGWLYSNDVLTFGKAESFEEFKKQNLEFFI